MVDEEKQKEKLGASRTVREVKAEHPDTLNFFPKEDTPWPWVIKGDTLHQKITTESASRLERFLLCADTVFPNFSSYSY